MMKGWEKMKSYNEMECIEQSVRSKLKEGKTYTFRFFANAGESGPENSAKKTVKKKKLKLLKCYPHIAHFIDEKEMKHSYQYTDVLKMLRGEVLNG